MQPMIKLQFEMHRLDAIKAAEQFAHKYNICQTNNKSLSDGPFWFEAQFVPDEDAQRYIELRNAFNGTHVDNSNNKGPESFNDMVNKGSYEPYCWRYQ